MKMYFSRLNFILVYSADPDEMPHFVAFHLCLHCLSKFPIMQAQCVTIKTFYSKK